MADLDLKKTFIPLECNPEVMTNLAHTLGVSKDLAFHDLYSLTDRDLIDIIPDPLALLFVYPDTTTAHSFQADFKASTEPIYNKAGPDEPVVYFRQTIRNACGLIGLLHCTTNNPSYITEGSNLDRLLKQAIPLLPEDRAQLLVDSPELEAAHGNAAQQGDTIAPPLGADPGHAFIAFVKGKDGNLWELPGPSWKSPVKCGELGKGEDVLCEKALNMGPRNFLKREEAGTGSLAFSCLVLAPRLD